MFYALIKAQVLRFIIVVVKGRHVLRVVPILHGWKSPHLALLHGWGLREWGGCGRLLGERRGRKVAEQEVPWLMQSLHCSQACQEVLLSL